MEVEGMDKRDNVGVREKTKSTEERDNTQKELKTVITGGASGTTGGEALEESPFGKIRILRREIRGHSSSGSIRKELIGNQLPTVGIKEGEEKRDSQKLLPRKDTQTGLIEVKIPMAKNKGSLKTEWIQVGSKRKTLNKGKSKGKENRPPANRPLSSTPMGHGLGPMIQNSFMSLQELTDQTISTSSGPIVGNSSCNVDSSHLGHSDVIGLEAGCNLGHSNEGGVLMEDSSTMHGRGTGAKSFPALVRDLKAHYQLNFIAILETRCSMDMSQQRASNLGFPHMELVECEGFSGGIWCLWDHGITSIILLERHRQFIHLQVTRAAGNSWTITVVYASPSSVSRHILWENLSRISTSIQGAWLEANQ
ncbi:hypothetical protein K1719_002235 [Acacia pycnantha]|nr:hypothetical protein K1719_002235 [Acacia pycnantha]